MFSDINVESLVVGKELLLVLVGLCVVFVSCFVMGLISIGRSRKIVKTKDDYDDLMRKMASLSSQRDALVAEIQSRGTEREEYARATKFLEMQPHLVAEVEKLEKAIADKELTLKGSSCMTVGGFPPHKFAWPLFYGLLSRSSGPRNFD